MEPSVTAAAPAYHARQICQRVLRDDHVRHEAYERKKVAAEARRLARLLPAGARAAPDEPAADHVHEHEPSVMGGVMAVTFGAKMMRKASVGRAGGPAGAEGEGGGGEAGGAGVGGHAMIGAIAEGGEEAEEEDAGGYDSADGEAALRRMVAVDAAEAAAEAAEKEKAEAAEAAEREKEETLAAALRPQRAKGQSAYDQV